MDDTTIMGASPAHADPGALTESNGWVAAGSAHSTPPAQPPAKPPEKPSAKPSATPLKAPWASALPRMAVRFADIRQLHGGTLYEAHRVSRRDLDELVQLFRERRRAMGSGAADEIWFADLLDDWTACMDGDETDGLDPQTIAGLAVGMREALSMRDALILTIIGGDDATRERVMQIGCHPHMPSSADIVAAMIEGTFTDASMRPDPARCGRGLALMAQIIASVDERYTAHPLAAIAYMLWWIGHEHAVAYALRALAADGECQLAVIVLAAVQRGMGPAWTGAAHAGRLRR